jgi:flagellar hook-associated protein 1 FlgK
MESYSIGLSSLTAAYAALDTIGNNIANAATEGYHRQRVDLTPSANNQSTGTAGGAGVDVVGVTRMIDTLLEREIVSQKSSYNCISQQLSTLSSLETSLGEFTQDGGLNSMMDNFFGALRSLAASPSDRVARNEVVTSAEAMASEFRRLGASLSGLNDQIVLQAQQVVESINGLTSQIAQLNGKIQQIEISGGRANNLLDRRDSLVSQLAELAGIEAKPGENGVVDISIAGLPVVAGSISVSMAVSGQSDGTLGVSAANTEGGSLNVEGGTLGGLLSLRNQLLPDLRQELDTLARGVIDQVNRYHSQGLGTKGSFTELAGSPITSTSLADAGVTDGDLYIRVTNTSTGQVQRCRIPVNVSGSSPDTLASIAAKIDAISGLNASVASSQLRVVADSGYTFDFLPQVLSNPSLSTLTAASPPSISVSGVYKGTTNQTLTFTVTGSGSVGNGNLGLNVTNSAGETVGTLNIGAGYAAGEPLDMSNGLKISVGMGDFEAGDHFTVDALETTDTSGLLVATGMNAFFSGASASEMRVCSEIKNDPNRIATAMGSDLADNTAVLKLAGIQDESAASLDGMTPSEYYHRVVASLSEDVALKRSQKDNTEAMIQSLQNQQSQISGVNINDEAAQLLLFEQMFQAAAKYLSSLQTAIDTLMRTLQ